MGSGQTVTQLTRYLRLVNSRKMPEPELRYLHLYSVDLTEVFDTMSRDSLWKIMTKVRSHGRCTGMVRQGMRAQVLDTNDVSTAFQVSKGSVLGPGPFSMLLTARGEILDHNSQGMFFFKFTLKNSIYCIT